MYYRVTLINFGNTLDAYYESLQEAIESGKKTGFEFAVHDSYGAYLGYCGGVSLNWYPCRPGVSEKNLIDKLI